MLKFSLDKAELPNQNYGIKQVIHKVNCHCCHDTGFIQPHLVKMAIPNYEENKDKKPICQRLQCGLGLRFTALIESNTLDTRFSHDMCQELHEIREKEEAEFTKKENTKVVNITSLVNKKSMPTYKKEDGIAEAKAWEEMGENA
jgi:hypothetical protein